MGAFRDQLKADMDASKELWRRAAGRRPMQHERERSTGDRVIPCPGPGGCKLTFCVCQEMRAQREKNASLREALHQCAEYFDDRSDVDTSDGEPVANKEMRLLGVVQTALGEK